MLIAPEEYRLFADLVKRVVLLEVLERVLERDFRTIANTPVKMRRPIGKALEEIRKRVARDALNARRELRRIGGEIIEVRQLSDVREVKARFRGFLHTQRYVNEWLRSECEETFLHQLSSQDFCSVSEAGPVEPSRRMEYNESK
ncbi:hypothetical protein CLV97_101119 [Planifilum fimeticola]|jgi:hypothetical protein|uniref:Uncharacterized protein n=1 Tax=Planifilum fimeticola TaxID=201975 RepID=A0A2T0LJP1_9BACL|nr:hypothetical protein [Planifilum fimeticola]PRX42630.1 hypothetical protein CLV97_101119 [Planifilum fimeticola]